MSLTQYCTVLAPIVRVFEANVLNGDPSRIKQSRRKSRTMKGEDDSWI
jgi:hypothetical protein